MLQPKLCSKMNTEACIGSTVEGALNKHTTKSKTNLGSVAHKVHANVGSVCDLPGSSYIQHSCMMKSENIILL